MDKRAPLRVVVNPQHAAPMALRSVLHRLAADIAKAPAVPARDAPARPALEDAARRLAAAAMPERRAELAAMRRCERAFAAALFAALASRDDDLRPIAEAAHRALRAIR